MAVLSVQDILNLVYDSTNNRIRMSGGLTTNLSGYAAGTVYSLTNAAAAIDFGTTDPSLTLTEAGTYLIIGTAQLKYNAATFVASQTATIKIRRTNNTAADLTNASRIADLAIVTTTTNSAGFVQTPVIFYTTTNTNDAIALWGSVSVAPSAGSLDVTSAEIIALKLY